MLPDTVNSVLRRKSRKVLTIAPDASVYEAIALMAENSVGALVVVTDGLPVGIVSERDYARKVILQGRSSSDTPVAQIMSSPVLTVTPHDTAQTCMQIMTERKIRHLPVLDDDGVVVGLVSIGDLVKAVIEDQREEIDQLQRYIAS